MKTRLPIYFLAAIGLLQANVSTAQNVGIGNSLPLMRLHVTDTDSAGALLENTQVLSPGISNALYFKTGANYSGAVKTIGTGLVTARLGLFTYAGSNANDLRESLTVLDNGNVGIGNTAPAYRLHVISSNGSGEMAMFESPNALSNGNSAALYFKMGTTGLPYTGAIKNIGVDASHARLGFFTYASATPAAMHESMTISDGGNLGIGVTNPLVDLSFPAAFGKKISMYPGGNGDVGLGVFANEMRVHGDNSTTDITFGYDTYASGFTERMRIKGTGAVCIGTTQVATGYVLNIGGKAIAEEVRVQLKAAWPDYVFAKDYNLKTLPELENYIQANQHLPNVPAAAEVSKSGIALGDMQTRLMEKVEELSLYVIDLQKQILQLKANTYATKK